MQSTTQYIDVMSIVNDQIVRLVKPTGDIPVEFRNAYDDFDDVAKLILTDELRKVCEERNQADIAVSVKVTSEDDVTRILYMAEQQKLMLITISETGQKTIAAPAPKLYPGINGNEDE